RRQAAEQLKRLTLAGRSSIARSASARGDALETAGCVPAHGWEPERLPARPMRGSRLTRGSRGPCLLVGQRRVGRVNVGRDAQSIADALQEGEQLLALLAAEVGAQVALMTHGRGKCAVEQIAPVRREVELARATIVRVLSAFEQAALLEGVEEGDHPARGDLEPLADRLLGLTLGEADRAQQRELPRLEPQRG